MWSERRNSRGGTAILAVFTASVLCGQTGSFDVVSIRPNPVPADRVQFQMFSVRPKVVVTGNRYYERQTTLQYLVMQAYGVWDYQISGLPDWGRAPSGEHYEIDARFADGQTPAAEQLQSMLQALLADRFQLKLHRDVKEQPVYALVVSKGGSKLKELPAEARNATMQSKVNLLAGVVDRPVIDHTGLTGNYDGAPFNALDWRKIGEEHRADPVTIPESLAGELEDRTGLKLEARKERIELLVIDRAEKPSVN